jgi:molybdenum cofactor biosynthesis enzyme MoaA
MKRFRRVNIEISNICNLQCSFCPEVHRDKKVMSRALFEKVIRDVAPLTDEVCLHLMGEPLGHPELSQFVDICEKYETPINLTTNGTLIDDVRSEILLRPIFRQVNFSVQSFEANFGSQDVSRYLSKIFAFTRRAFSDFGISPTRFRSPTKIKRFVTKSKRSIHFQSIPKKSIFERKKVISFKEDFI